MYIIGTAGHVDHGKTSLVRTMTGIDTDRLPEEKRRALTIELGFASYVDATGVRIGVVDVPGHERFIRNMAAGTWALDCALLTIAADDGWMCQSQDHLHILKGMGVPSIIIVVTKCDTVDDKRISEVSKQAQEKCSQVLAYEPPVVHVSAVTAQGIDTLKRIISESLHHLQRPRSPICLYIDRSFIMNGMGPVVTGSLRGGSLQVGDEITVLPKGLTGRIRSLQSFGTTTQRVVEGSRTAIGIQGIALENLKKGYCLTTVDKQFFPSKRAVVSLASVQKEEPLVLKNHATMEIAWGTAHAQCSIHLLSSSKESLSKGFALVRIICSQDVSWYWDQPFICMQPGGSTVVAHGRLITTDPIGKQELSLLSRLFSESPKISEIIPSEAFFRLYLYGFAYLPNEEKSVLSIMGNTYTQFGCWYIQKDIETHEISRILQLASRGQGIPLETVKQSMYPRDMVGAIIESMLRRQVLVLSNGILRKPTEKIRELSLAEKQLLSRIIDTGYEGLPVKQLQKTDRVVLGSLLQSKRVLIVESTFIYPTETYTKMKFLVLKDRMIGDTFSIGDAKRYIPLSRKYMIPLLNAMEAEGLIERVGDVRKVRKLLQDT